MDYSSLKWNYRDIDQRKRVVENLKRLRTQLDAEVPRKDAMDSLLLATWNIREFDSSKYGYRMWESYYYIAEVISRFDLVAVQEVREDLVALQRTIRILGPWWDYIATDITEGAAGNGERLVFLYDNRKVKFKNIAGEVVLAPHRPRAEAGEAESAAEKTAVDANEQLARTPFLCAFQAEWFKFSLCTVHIYYGEDKPDDPRRIREIEYIAQFLAKRAKSEGAQGSAFILLGDFNIFRPEDVTMEKLVKAGFMVPANIKTLPEIVAKGKHYDQIAFLGTGGRIDKNQVEAGVLDFYKSVYRADDKAEYAPMMLKPLKGDVGARPGTGIPEPGTEPQLYPAKDYSQWRTHQMSDHLPLWVKVPVNDAAMYLDRLGS
jgi:endonuclease/exonuclease/phosphatase family metal-dependent hydrolase